MEICALVISILAFALSLFQFLRDSSRQKREATLAAYNELQNSVFSVLTTFSKPLPPLERGNDLWNTFTIHLAKLERFSVGINTGIYSLKTLNSLGGAYYIYEFEKLEPIIKQKRTNDLTHGEHYNAFEKTVKHLIQYRNEKKRIKKLLLCLIWKFQEI